MKFTWGHLFTLLKWIWGMSQSKIAELLEVNRSTISRLISGEQKTFKRDSYTEVYRKLFAPRLKSTADKNKFLYEMKQGLNRMKFGEIVKDLEGKDCESFVVSLLQMANENGAKDKIPQRSPSGKESTKGVSSQNAPSLIKMPKEREPLQFSHIESVNDFWNDVFLSTEIPETLWINKPEHTDSSDDVASIPEVSADNLPAKSPTKTDVTQEDDVASRSQASEQGKQPSGPTK